MLICQSCGMNIEEDQYKGTNADGGLSDQYCVNVNENLSQVLSNI